MQITVTPFRVTPSETNVIHLTIIQLRRFIFHPACKQIKLNEKLRFVWIYRDILACAATVGERFNVRDIAIYDNECDIANSQNKASLNAHAKIGRHDERVFAWH